MHTFITNKIGVNMKRSHSRHTYPADKPLPVEVAHDFANPEWEPTTTQREVAKKMHKHKQRTYNKKVIEEELGEDV